ncbi:MAG: transposase [Clostridia bacterium]|nr:transposase [Clostridia bacterium]
MPRIARENQISNYYHVIVQGDEKKFIFKKETSKLKYLRLLMKNASRNKIQILAYCIMDNHAHILVHVSEPLNLSKMMSQVGTSFGIYYSKIRQNVGHVFRDRFKSEPIVDISHLANCIKYIHENPVKACIVNNPGLYRYSSYNEYAHKIGSYNQIFSLNIFSTETLSTLTQPLTLESNFLEVPPIFEDIDIVFRELTLQYDMTDLHKKEIFEICNELFERCNASRLQISQRLNISYYHLTKLLKEYENFKQGHSLF